MNNKKVLAVALSAGLVLGGAYAIDANNNVAYAAEPSATKAELEKQIADAESQKFDPDKKKAQCNNAINYRAGLRKFDDLSDEKLNEYDQLDEKDRAEIKELDKKIAEINQTIANLKAQLDAADKKDEEPKKKPEDSSEEVEWNGYDDDYNREWKDASREQDEKLAAKKEAEEAPAKSGYETEKEAEAAAEKALENDPINNSYLVRQGADGSYYYVLSPVIEEEVVKEEVKEYNQNDVDGYDTKEEAIKAGEALRDKEGLTDSYVVTATQGVNGKWFYRLEVKEDEEESTPLTPLVPADEICPAPGQTPGPDNDIVPSIPDFSTDDDIVVVPGTVVDPVVEEDKPVVVGNDDEQKAKDLTDKLNEISKEIKDTLVENEKEVAKEDKEEVKPSDDNKEEGSKEEKEEKEDKDDKADKEDKNDDNKADAKKEAVKVEKVVKHSNPKTGVESIVPVVSTLAISMAGIVATRKKND